MQPGGWLALALIATASCGGALPERDTDSASLPIVYGRDDRREFFEVEDAAVRLRMAHSLVALVAKSAIVHTPQGPQIRAPSYGDSVGLCPGEPFVEQPAAAFCSGVLVDRDLVLTSGHCTRAYHTDQFVAVLGYHYQSPGQLVLRDADIIEVAEILDEALDPVGMRPRDDHAWLRLANDVGAPRVPAPIRRLAAAPGPAAGVIAMSAGGGVPMKIDQGGVISDLGAPWFDYFTASTDTAKGSSGGGAFDAQLALLGVLARGGPDLVPTDGGCAVTFRQTTPTAKQEEFTFASRALERLCAHHPQASSLCRADCGDPCAALPDPPPSENTAMANTTATGCSLAPQRQPSAASGRSLALLVALALAVAHLSRRL